jgi:hypothetical protein
MGARVSGGKLRTRNGKLALAVAGTFTPAPPAPAATDFGLGLIGQSNMYNRQFSSTQTAYPLSHPDATEYAGASPSDTSGTLQRIGNVGKGSFAGADKWGAPSAIYGDNYNHSGNSGDGPVMLSGLLAAGLGARVRVINRAVSGTSITAWISIANGGPTSGNCWEVFAAAVTNLATQLGTTPAALLRMVMMQQGETDAHTMPPAQWSAQVDIVRLQCKALAGNRDDFLFGVYALGPGHYNGSLDGEFGAYRVEAIRYATTTPGVFFAGNTYDVSTANLDPVHIISEGFHRADRRAGKAALYALGATSAATGRGGSGAGPRVDTQNTTFAAGVITVNMLHAGGNALLDGAGGTGDNLTTFEVKDKTGAVIPYAPKISGPAQVKLTLTGSFTGPLTLSNALRDAPCHTGTASYTFVPAACLYDNDGYWQYGTATATTIGSPSQPCAAFTVTGS